MDIPEISKQDLKHLLLVGCHLHRFQGSSKDDLPNVIQRQGMVQLDPLNPAGRYHDHFFLSRIKEYSQRDFEKVAYSQKLVFEYYNPNLCAISIEQFPIFWNFMEISLLHSYYRSKIEHLNEIKPKILDRVLKFVQKNGKTNSKSLDLGRAKQEFASWKSNQTASAVLEYLWLMGKLAVVERNQQFHKSYELIENYVPENFLYRQEISPELYPFYRLMTQQKSYPVINIGNIQQKNDMLIFGKKKIIEAEWFDLPEFPSIIKLEDSKKGFLVPKNFNELLKEQLDEFMRCIGVLDPLIWDRDLLKNLFNFEYTWEVYKKEKDRIWGYYVLPLLYKGRFIGRFEARYETKELKTNNNILKIFNFSLEKGEKFTGSVKGAFEELLKRFQLMVGASAAEYEKPKIKQTN